MREGEAFHLRVSVILNDKRGKRGDEKSLTEKAVIFCAQTSLW